MNRGMYIPTMRQYGFGDWIGKKVDSFKEDPKWWHNMIPGLGVAARAAGSLREDGDWDFSTDNLFAAGLRAGSPAVAGFMSDKFMKENAGTIGTIGGTVLGAALGNPMMGAQIGGAIGNTVQGQYESEIGMQQYADMQSQQNELMKRQNASIAEQHRIDSARQNRVGNKYSPAPQYGAMFKCGGRMKSYAGGGMMNNTQGATYFANGGTHEQSPIGGIPIGNRGMVEEGEVLAKLKDGDYIFSNRF